jgi:hypothetical protein
LSITGRVNQITNPLAFFAPLLSNGKPTSGFVPFTNHAFVVEVTGLLGKFFPFPIPVSLPPTNVSTVDGSFTMPDLPTELVQWFENVRINVKLNGLPFYRTETFHPANLSKNLEMFIFQPSESEGVTAGQVSTGLASAGLPGNTTLRVNSSGFGVIGSKSGADINFDIIVVPDTSHNLSLFFDLELGHYDVSVGFPADCKTNAHTIVENIRSALQTSGSKANQTFAGLIVNAVAKLLPSGIAASERLALSQKLLEVVSIQFVSVKFPNTHPWALSDKKDSAIVLIPQLAIGFPRAF